MAVEEGRQILRKLDGLSLKKLMKRNYTYINLKIRHRQHIKTKVMVNSKKITFEIDTGAAG